MIQDRWIQRPGFKVRKMLILKWIFLGTLLTMGYEAILLSSLIRIQYEATIDNINELDNTGLPLLMLEGTASHIDLSKDPRPIIRRIFNRSIV